jgi:hypothetical protein
MDRQRFLRQQKHPGGKAGVFAAKKPEPKTDSK